MSFLILLWGAIFSCNDHGSSFDGSISLKEFSVDRSSDRSQDQRLKSDTRIDQRTPDMHASESSLPDLPLMDKPPGEAGIDKDLALMDKYAPDQGVIKDKALQDKYSGDMGPITGWAKHFWSSGAKSQISLNDIAVDGAGNSLITGDFIGTATFGALSLGPGSAASIAFYVAKLDPSGKVVWVVSTKNALGNSFADGVAVDKNGNCFVGGTINGYAEFGELGGYWCFSQGCAFVVKIDATGSYQWVALSTSKSSGWAAVFDLALGGNGHGYLAGDFYIDSIFGLSSLAMKPPIATTNRDIFIAEVGANGQWVTAVSAGGPGADCAFGISADASGNALVTGQFEGTASVGATSITSAGNKDIFIARLAATGTFSWAISAGGTGYDSGYSALYATTGDAYVTGSFSTAAVFGSTSVLSKGSYDLFASKLDPTGKFIWTTPLGSSGLAVGEEIAQESSGNLLVAGAFGGTASVGSTTLTAAGPKDVLLARMSQAGYLQKGLSAGGAKGGIAFVMALDSAGNKVLGGSFAGTATFDKVTLTSTGAQDIFVWMLPANAF